MWHSGESWVKLGSPPCRKSLPVPDVSSLSLYQTRFCPYCERVRVALRRFGLEIELRDVTETLTRRRELVEATGRSTVPCLRIANSDDSVDWMHESEEIIAFLERRFGS